MINDFAAAGEPGSKSRSGDGPGVTIVGGGVAGLAAACALAEAGLRVRVLERRGYLGGRASSYLHPGTGEVIDNCQHVLFGCCTNLIGFYERIGVADRIFWDSHLTMIEPGGRQSVLAPSGLPAPLHGLPAILKAKCFSVRDKLSLVSAFSSMLFTRRPDPAENLAHWLGAHGQSAGAMHRFWRLVIASALNADLDQIGLPYAEKVIRELFLSSPRAGAMGMSRVPLTELYGGAERYLESRGGSVEYFSNVEWAAWDEGTRQWTIAAAGAGKMREFRSEALVLALPFEATAKLIPKMPANDGAIALAEGISRLEHWPICSVHLWFDGEITDLNHAVLLDRDIDWMYHKSRWQTARDPGASYIELVISASREFAALSREEALSRAVTQLGEYFPKVKSAKLLKSALIKEVRATFGVPPGIDGSRAGAVSPWPGCFLAGDWTRTGWPSTMESAARSGHLAAEALLRSMGNGGLGGECRDVLVPDLAPTGWMKLLRRSQVSNRG